MARKGRNTIQKHTNQAVNMLDRCLYHLKEIDDIYSGVKYAPDDDDEIHTEFVEINPDDPYAKYREYIATIVTALVIIQEQVNIIKTF